MNDRKLVKLLALLVIGALVTAFTLAAPKANPRKGKVYFKKYCRVCHDGSTEQAELQPITKTMAQWERAFGTETVTEGCVGRAVNKTGTELTDQDLLDIQSYLIYHAADSDHPATCGKQ